MSSNLPSIKARIVPGLCTGGHRCLPEMHCPSAAIKKNPAAAGAAIVIDEEKCIGCGKCVKVCKNNAIKLERFEQSLGL